MTVAVPVGIAVGATGWMVAVGAFAEDVVAVAFPVPVVGDAESVAMADTVADGDTDGDADGEAPGVAVTVGDGVTGITVPTGCAPGLVASVFSSRRSLRLVASAWNCAMTLLTRVSASGNVDDGSD